MGITNESILQVFAGTEPFTDTDITLNIRIADILTVILSKTFIYFPDDVPEN